MAKNRGDETTDTLTLKEVYQIINLPESRAMARSFLSPYIPDRYTPARLLVGAAKSLGVGIVVITTLGLMTFVALTILIYIGPWAGLAVAVMFCIMAYDVADGWLEGLFRRDDDAIRAAQAETDTLGPV